MKRRYYITVVLEVCQGKGCIAGTHGLVTVVLDNPVAGREPDEHMRSYPPINQEATRMTFCYAAE